MARSLLTGGVFSIKWGKIVTIYLNFMTKNTTILSEKESVLLENLIVKYGLIVRFEHIYKELKGDFDRQKVKKTVGKLVKNGWLVRIQKGAYAIANLESRGFVDADVSVIAQTMLQESYVSFEEALRYHGIFDQYLRVVSSVCTKKHAEKEIQGILYTFARTSKKNYYGFERVRVEGGMVQMATLEKAILDMVHFRRSLHSLDLVLEKFREYGDSFDFMRLQRYADRQSITVRKILGFLLDAAKIDSKFLAESIRKTEGASRMTNDSECFSSKWNLYYHKHFA